MNTESLFCSLSREQLAFCRTTTKIVRNQRKPCKEMQGRVRAEKLLRYFWGFLVFGATFFVETAFK